MSFILLSPPLGPIQLVLTIVVPSICSWNRLSHDTEEYKTEKVDIVRKNITLWRRAGGAAPSRGKTLKLPFEFTLPVDAPPSFSFEDYMNAAHVRYAIEATGVRSGPFAFDQTLRIPLVVVVPDPLGSSLRPQLKLGWQDGWGRMRMEREIRRNPWGPWSTAKLEVRLHLILQSIHVNIGFYRMASLSPAPCPSSRHIPPIHIHPIHNPSYNSQCAHESQFEGDTWSSTSAS